MSLNIFTTRLRQGDVAGFFVECERLREKLHSLQVPLIQDRSYRLKKYKTCFKGSDLIGWLIDHHYCSSRAEALAACLSMVMFGVIHHVVDDHNFKDEELFYRFRKDDKTYKGDDPEYQKLARVAIHVHATMHASGIAIADREYGLRKFKTCFIARDFIEWLQTQKLAQDHDDALALGLALQDAGFIHHVCDDHKLKDAYLFFRFRIDELKQPPDFFTFISSVEGGQYLGHIDMRLKVLLPRGHQSFVRMVDAMHSDGSDTETASNDTNSDDTRSSFGSSQADDDAPPPVPSRRSLARQSTRISTKSVMLMDDISPLANSGSDFEEVAKLDDAKLQLQGAQLRIASQPAAPANEPDPEFTDDQIVEALKNMREREEQYLQAQSWFHGDISRDQAQTRLSKTAARSDGTWLMRRSQKDHVLVFSLSLGRQIWHIKILRWAWLRTKDASGFPMITYAASNRAHFKDLATLVEFYEKEGGDLPSVLGTPIPREKFSK